MKERKASTSSSSKRQRIFRQSVLFRNLQKHYDDILIRFREVKIQGSASVFSHGIPDKVYVLKSQLFYNNILFLRDDYSYVLFGNLVRNFASFLFLKWFLKKRQYTEKSMSIYEKICRGTAASFKATRQKIAIIRINQLSGIKSQSYFVLLCFVLGCPDHIGFGSSFCVCSFSS